MPVVSLRPFRAADAELFDTGDQVPGSFEFWGWRATNSWRSGFAQNGFISEDHGNLVVDVEGVGAVGDVGWFAVHNGPPPHGRALNIGIGLFAEHRGKGHGTEAQRLLAEYLFAYTRIERLEASTDVLNIAEQKSLVKAGFTREGVLRHAQWRAGAFHDCVMFSRLRGDAP
jgi:RimJ/RimL family protein N-acetyltransferase